MSEEIQTVVGVGVLSAVCWIVACWICRLLDVGCRRPTPVRPTPVFWNPYLKVVCDHRDGTVDVPATNRERALRGLPVPWTPDIGDKEVHEKEVP